MALALPLVSLTLDGFVALEADDWLYARGCSTPYGALMNPSLSWALLQVKLSSLSLLNSPVAAEVAFLPSMETMLDTEEFYELRQLWRGS